MARWARLVGAPYCVVWIIYGICQQSKNILDGNPLVVVNTLPVLPRFLLCRRESRSHMQRKNIPCTRWHSILGTVAAGSNLNTGTWDLPNFDYNMTTLANNISQLLYVIQGSNTLMCTAFSCTVQMYIMTCFCVIFVENSICARYLLSLRYCNSWFYELWYEKNQTMRCSIFPVSSLWPSSLPRIASSTY